jgi:signal transduction histidine kinase
LENKTSALEQIIKNMPGVFFRLVLTTTHQFKFVEISAKIEDLIGTAGSEFLNIPDPLMTFIQNEDYLELKNQLETSAAYSAPFEWQGRIFVKNKTKWIHIKANPFKDSFHKMSWDGLIIDITLQRFQMDLFLTQKSRQISDEIINSLNQMASGIAHEINTPLTTANMSFEIVKNHIYSEKISDPVFEKWIQRFDQATQKISLVIDRLRQLSKNDFNSNQKIILNLNDVLKTCINHVSAFYSEQFQIKIDVNLCAENLPILADEGKVFQAILNLIANSKDAVLDQPNKSIEITTYSNPAYNYLRIKDHGVGISKEILPKVFEPFYTTKYRNLNSGVGLSISGSILTDHGAIIDIASFSIEENPQRHGTEINIKFPIAAFENQAQMPSLKTS